MSDDNGDSKGMAAAGFAISGAKVAIALLVAHSARLKGAKTENLAIPAAVQAFDSDLQSVVTAFNAGQITKTDLAKAVLSIDSSIYAYMHSLVGKPGTAWGMAQQPINSNSYTTCGKACTAACCVFNANIHPVLAAIYCWASGIQLTELNGDTYGSGNNLTATTASIVVPEVYPPTDKAYGNFTRPGYTIALYQSQGVAVQASILSTISELLGEQPTALQGLTQNGASGGASISTPVILFIGVGLLGFAALLIVRK